MTVTDAYHLLFTVVFLGLALTVFFCLLRAVLGPRLTDRLVSVNMIGTQVILLIGALTVALQENWLADVCIIYAMLSFIAVVVLAKVYTGVYAERKRLETEKKSVSSKETEGIS